MLNTQRKIDSIFTEAARQFARDFDLPINHVAIEAARARFHAACKPEIVADERFGDEAPGYARLLMVNAQIINSTR